MAMIGTKTEGEGLETALPAAVEGPWPVTEEPRRGWWLAGLVLLVMVGLYGGAIAQYYAGAHSGVDQAGYLMTARLIADEQRLFFYPENKFQFASRMCIFTEQEASKTPEHENFRVYAKYPFGYPLLAAVGRWVGGINGMYVINPLCTVLACLFAYFLFRTALGRLTSLVGVVWLAVNPLTLYYANDANSHASTLLCVVFGFWGLLRWWQTGQVWRGFFGAFALGYACTIRYSEFLLVLPVAFAALANLRWDRRRIVSSATVLAGWAIPVATLALVCWVSFGAPWKTGYTYCKEDTGFGWRYFVGQNETATNANNQGNWETLLVQLNHMGLFMLWPFGVVGLLGMMGRSWRLGTILALWVLPSTFLYMFYYWAPQGENTTGYLRFFLSVLPGLIFAGLWLLEGILRAASQWGAAPGRAGWVPLVKISVLGVGTAAWLVYYFAPEAGGTARWRFAAAAGVLLLVAGIWLFERKEAARRATLATGLAVLTALGCGTSLSNTLPQLEGMHARFVALRQTADAVYAAAPPYARPRPTMLFADEDQCHQLDSIGGYQLFSLAYFPPQSSKTFAMYQKRWERKESDDPSEDPNPVQRERARLYMELLGRPAAGGGWTARSREDLATEMVRIMTTGLQRGQRVMVLLSAENSIRTVVPRGLGVGVRQVASWINTPPVVEGEGLPRWATLRTNRWPGGVRNVRGGPWALYEVTLEKGR